MDSWRTPLEMRLGIGGGRSSPTEASDSGGANVLGARTLGAFGLIVLDRLAFTKLFEFDALDRAAVDGVLRGAKSVWSGPMASPPERLFTDDLAWDKQATHTRDVESFLPIAGLQSFATEGRIHELAQRFHGVPTDYSQRRTTEEDAPEIARRCREDGVDAALLVPL